MKKLALCTLILGLLTLTVCSEETLVGANPTSTPSPTIHVGKEDDSSKTDNKEKFYCLMEEYQEQ